MIFSNIIVSNPHKAGRVSEKVSVHTGKRKAPSAHEHKLYQPWMEGTPIKCQRNRKEIKIFRTGQSDFSNHHKRDGRSPEELGRPAFSLDSWGLPAPQRAPVGSEIQANTADSPSPLPTFVFPTCPVPLRAAAALCVLPCQYAGVLVTALCLWRGGGGLHCTGTLIRFWLSD